RVGKEDVAGDLFLEELAVGLVVVERADDVVAIGPGVGADFVFVVAVSVAVVGDIEPVTPPAFAVAGRSEETIDERLVGGGTFVGEKGLRFLGRRREAG